MWTVSDGTHFFASNELVGCGHMSGPFGEEPMALPW
jgi:hypothetical protein